MYDMLTITGAIIRAFAQICPRYRIAHVKPWIGRRVAHAWGPCQLDQDISSLKVKVTSWRPHSATLPQVVICTEPIMKNGGGASPIRFPPGHACST